MQQLNRTERYSVLLDAEMASRGCKHSADSFCYICGEFIKTRAKKYSLIECNHGVVEELLYDLMMICPELCTK